jgi:hypothetical protein
MAKTILKLNGSKAAVKCAGTAINDTIALSTDLLLSTEALTVDGTPRVNLLAVSWGGAPAGSITITRNSVVILQLATDAPGTLDFQDKDFSDNIQNDKDIVITSTGSAQVYLLLRKVTGYSSKIETAQFSVYDNTTVVGS